ncbi:MAG: Hsp20 family protein [Hyphomicrobiaceae bacterium]|nr:Hsp20 family protein [Hyphomicrobiaceae bacterium]
MPRLSLLSSPLLLGFDEIERFLDRASHSGGEGYPPYNIERLADKANEGSTADTNKGANGDNRAETDRRAETGRRGAEGAKGQYLRITLAVAGFRTEQLTITLENNQLTIKGQQPPEAKGDYLHQGIAARQFQRTFVLAERIEVISAELRNGLLSINLHRPEPENRVQQIEINDLG